MIPQALTGYTYTFDPHFASHFATSMATMAAAYGPNTQRASDPKLFLFGLLQFQRSLESVPAVATQRNDYLTKNIHNGTTAYLRGDDSFDVHQFINAALSEYHTLGVLPNREDQENYSDVAMRIQYQAAVRTLQYALCDDNLEAVTERQRNTVAAMTSLIGSLKYFGYDQELPDAVKQQIDAHYAVYFPTTATQPRIDQQLSREDLTSFVTAIRTSKVSSHVDVIPKDPASDLVAASKTLLKNRISKGLPAVQTPIAVQPQSEASTNIIPPPLPTQHPIVEADSRRLLIRASVLDTQTIRASYYISPEDESKPLGQGAMGTVYKGKMILTDSHGTIHEVRPVAIKVSSGSSDVSQEVAEGCFMHDLLIQGGILEKEPGVVTVYDAGRLSNGNPFMVMELVEGTTLESHIEKMSQGLSPYELDTLLKYLQEISQTLSAVNQRGVAHRDIKPANAFITRREGRQNLHTKLSDFGVSKTLSPGEKWDGSAVGTLLYMGPEMMIPHLSPASMTKIPWFRDVVGNVDPKKMDVYAFGMLAYETLSGGHLPYAGLEQKDLIEFFELGSPYTPLTHVKPDAHIPQALDDIIRKCISPNPQDRYNDMEEVSFELINYRAKEKCDQAWQKHQSLESRVDDKSRPISEHEFNHLTGEWEKLFLEGLQEYESNYEAFPNNKLREKILSRLLELFKYADPLGRNDLLDLCREKSKKYDPETQHPNSQAIHRPILFSFNYLGQVAPGSRATVQVVTEPCVAGTFTHDPTVPATKLRASPTASAPAAVPRGSHRHRVNFDMPGYAPLSFLLQARPKEEFRPATSQWSHHNAAGKPLVHHIDIPLIPIDWLPNEEWVVGMPGDYAAWQDAGSFSERIENIRHIHNPFLIGPLVTCKDWYELWFKIRIHDPATLSAISEVNPSLAEELRSLPAGVIDTKFWSRNWMPLETKSWKPTETFQNIKYRDTGLEIDSDAPVTHVWPWAAQLFLDYQTALYRREHPQAQQKTKMRLIGLTEWKASVRGFTAQMAPWGDSVAVEGTASIHSRPSRFQRRRGLRPQSMSPANVHDFSNQDQVVFWGKQNGKFIPTIAHAAGNVQKLVSLNADERKRIQTAFGLTDSDIDARLFAAGVTHDSVAGNWIDGIDPKTKPINAGIMPVIELPRDLFL